MVCNQVVAVYISGTYTPIIGATVTCTGQAPKTTNVYGQAEFSLDEDATHSFRANADGYVISDAYAHTIAGCQDRVTIKLEKEEQIQITVKRPTWVSMSLWPEQAEYPTNEELQVRGYLRHEAEPYTEGEVWLIDTDTWEIISDRYPMGASGFYVLKWTPLSYRGCNVTVGCDAFVDSGNPLGAWSEMPNGSTLYINVVKGAAVEMALVLPNPYSLLFVDHTIIACDDWEQACTEFRFQIRNDGDVAMAAWYKVSVVGGATLYDSTIATIDPGATSAVIADLICALPGGLPVGTHTIKVETGPEGQAATDSYSEDISVIEEPQPPVVYTEDAYNITETSATLDGYIDETKGIPTDIGFEYGKTISYGNTVWAGKTTIATYFTKEITGLDPATVYHLRAIATNNVESAYGEDKSFTTIEVVESGYLSITLPNTTLLEEANVMACDDWQHACTRFNFEIANRKRADLTAWYTVSIAGGATLYSGTVTVPTYSSSATISDLVCALPGGLPVGEHEILVEVGPEGHSLDTHISETLTVLEYSTPTVYTLGVEDPTYSSVRLVGELKDVGIETRVGFEYNILGGSTKTVWCEGWIRSGEFKAAVGGLEEKEVYLYRAIAEAGGITSYGEERSFETCPAVIDAISLGWNLEDAKMDEYNAHFVVFNLSETKSYRITLSSDKGYEYARVDNVTGTKETEIKVNIPLDLLEEHGYTIHCSVYNVDTKKYLLIQHYLASPFDLKLYTNIGGPLQSIPSTIRTDTDYLFTIQIDNTGEKDRKAALIFTFVGRGIGPGFVFAFPHTEPSEEGEGIIILAGESVGYEITIHLPNNAVPEGATSATYDLDVLLSAFPYP